MGNQKNLIELNGQKYDTVTGKVLATNSHSSHPKHHVSSGSVEGFMPHHKAPAAKGIHHQTSKSRTLMRSAVHKPALTALQGTVEHIAQLQRNTHVVSDHKRAQRAKAVDKSSFISRFGAADITGTAKVSSKTAHLPVKPAPAPAAVSAATPMTSTPAVAPVVAKKSFTTQLEKADSHTQPKVPKAKLRHRTARKLHMKPRTLSIVASVAAIVLLAGFFGYQYRAYASVKMAAARSGVSATLPAQPAGFSLSDKVQYKPGEVSLAYKSNSDARNFTVTQTASAWNSEALEENFIAQLPPPHSSTLYPSGKTVFTYGNDGSNATWVSGGVWYKVEGNSALTSTQLQGIINSL